MRFSEIGAAMEKQKLPGFAWLSGRIPNDNEVQPSIRIGDNGLVCRLASDQLVGAMTPWAWKTLTGKPVFNFVSERRDFSHNDRVLILANSFFEYTTPAAPKVKLKDQHEFTMAGEEWFWIAGIVKEGAFAMLTVEPGPDVAPYHDRQIVALAPRAGIDWLTLARPQPEILRAAPAGTLQHRQVRRDGIDLPE